MINAGSNVYVEGNPSEAGRDASVFEFFDNELCLTFYEYRYSDTSKSNSKNDNARDILQKIQHIKTKLEGERNGEQPVPKHMQFVMVCWRKLSLLAEAFANMCDAQEKRKEIQENAISEALKKISQLNEMVDKTSGGEQEKLIQKLKTRQSELDAFKELCQMTLFPVVVLGQKQLRKVIPLSLLNTPVLYKIKGDWCDCKGQCKAVKCECCKALRNCSPFCHSNRLCGNGKRKNDGKAVKKIPPESSNDSSEEEKPTAKKPPPKTPKKKQESSDDSCEEDSKKGSKNKRKTSSEDKAPKKKK